MIKNILKLEGLTILFASIYAYLIFGGNLLLFLILIITPDISMIGYLKNKKIGAKTYNLVHNYVLGLVLILSGLIINKEFLTLFGLILTAHVGMDRFLGYGLKYDTDFKNTHLQKI